MDENHLPCRLQCLQRLQRESRRRFLRHAGTLSLALGAQLAAPCSARAATDLPIADAHSHIGLITPAMIERPLKAQMEDAGVTLLSWNIVGDGRWIQRTNTGIRQLSTPAPGEQAT